MKTKKLNVNINLLCETIFQLYKGHPLAMLSHDVRTNEDFYPYIPTQPPTIQLMIEDLLKLNKFGGKFVDAGCGLPVIPKIFSVLGFEANGIEYNEIYNKVFGNIVRTGNILTHNFEDYDVIYSYNPIIDDKLMRKAIKNIQKTMKSGATFYFNDAKGVTKGLGFEDMATPHVLVYNLYRFIKP